MALLLPNLSFLSSTLRSVRIANHEYSLPIQCVLFLSSARFVSYNFISTSRIATFPSLSYHTLGHCLFASSPDSFFFVFFRRYKQIKTATIIRTVAVSVGLVGLEPMVSLRSVTNTSALLFPPLAAQGCGASTMPTWHSTKKPQPLGSGLRGISRARTYDLHDVNVAL